MPLFLFFFFKQKTAYEMRISDWSSDVCSSDLWRILCTTGAQSGDLSLHDLISTGSPDHAAAAIGGDAPFIQIYTSGTTGVPKGVVVRSEERRVGKECVGTCIQRGWPYH